jgi:hypothetical protein
VRTFAPVMLKRLKKLGIDKTDPNELTPEEKSRYGVLTNHRFAFPIVNPWLHGPANLGLSGLWLGVELMGPKLILQLCFSSRKLEE